LAVFFLEKAGIVSKHKNKGGNNSMPWTLNDYPSSMKNLPHATKKKASDIANAMIDEGYHEERAIPIATEHAKEWRDNARKNEVNRYEKGSKPKERSAKDKKYENNTERLEEVEHVVAQDNGWTVKSSGAKRASYIYEKKDEAVKRAKEIAKNKATHVTIYKRDVSVQEKQAYTSEN